MFAIGILWLLAISCTTADDVPDVVPTFTWAAESGSISMIIDFHDGGDDDVAVLEYVHDEFGDDEKDEEDDECLMTGYLTNEADVPITVDGCPGNENFQVIFNSRRIPNSAFEVENGQVTAFHPDSHQMSASDDDDNPIILDDRDLHEKYRLGNREIVDRDLPSSFEVTLALAYDNLFLNNVCGGDHAKAKTRVGKIVSLAQTYFHDSATLGTKIDLKVKEIKHTDNAVKLRNSGVTCNTNCMIDWVGKNIAANNPLEVDNYHFISADNPGPGVWDTAGVARTVGYSGWTVMGSVCINDKKNRVGISEFWGDPTKWKTGKLNAALTFAHELGHSLGMPHDFDGSDINNPRYDSSGTSCLNVDGIMSYKNTKTTWSPCSKESIKGWFNQLDSKNMNCKKGGSTDGGSEDKCTDTDNGKTDNWGDGCPQYAQNKGWCGRYNNAVFQSDKMCCACGGGSTAGGSSGTSGGTTSTDCTPAKSVGQCGNCLKGDQCKEGYCCPYMKKCVPSSSTPCYLPIANCQPMCYDSMDVSSCSCKNTDFPTNWAKPTC